MLRFLMMSLSAFLFLSSVQGQTAVEYIWKGTSASWGDLPNWKLAGSTPSKVPGDSASAYTHWFVTNGVDSLARTDVGTLGPGGRYLKGIKILGVQNTSVDKIPLFVKNTNDGVYLRLSDGGILVGNSAGSGTSVDFGVAQLRVVANQTWTVESGRSFYIGHDDSPPSGGGYSLSLEDTNPKTVTLAGAGATRLGKAVMIDKISPLITFVLNGKTEVPTLDLGNGALSNTVRLEQGGRLEGMTSFQGVFSTTPNSLVTFVSTSARVSALWNLGQNTTFSLESSTLDMTSAGVDVSVVLSGKSGITGSLGTLSQTIAEGAEVVYVNRKIGAGEIQSVGQGVTITLDNSELYFEGEIPPMDLIIQGSCVLSGSGVFSGNITYAPGSNLSFQGDIKVPRASLSLERDNVSSIDGIVQVGSKLPALPSVQAQEYIISLDSSFEALIKERVGDHVFSVQFDTKMTSDVVLNQVPLYVSSWSYNKHSKVLSLSTSVPPNPILPPGISGSKPNIIFVLVDDMGWGDLEENWNHQEKNGRVVERRRSFKTPELNTIAQEGMQLRRHYSAAPVCAPARASLLLGVHQGHSRVVRNNTFDHPIENSHTLGTLLKGAGYHTAAIGKWGVGGGGQSGFAESARPNQRGFDYFYGIMAHLGGHYHYLTGPGRSSYCDIFEYNAQDTTPSWQTVNAKVPATAYDTDLFGARAKQWILDHKNKNASQPFFMYLALPAPHGCVTSPACAYPAGKGKDAGLQWVEGEDGFAASNTATEQRALDAGVTGSFAPNTYIYPENNVFTGVAKHHATMIRRIDDVLADLIQTLKDLGIDENTMIVFTSDNGPHNESGSGNYNNGAQDPTYFQSYGMMDGIKRDCWEGGMRVPTLVRWPKAVPAKGISLKPSQFHDWMATFADVAGVPIPARCDGVSLLPVLAGVPEVQKPSTIYAEYNHTGNTPNYADFASNHKGRAHGLQQVVYVEGFKGIRVNIANVNQDFEIYDTEIDPQETNNVAVSRPDLQEKMKAQASRVRRAAPSMSTTLDAGTILPVEPVKTLVQGLRWRSWSKKFDWVPDFSQWSQEASQSGKVKALDVTVGSGTQKGVELTGYLMVETAGEYKFYLKTDSNPGSKAFVRLHDMQLLDADYDYIAGSEVNSDARTGAAVDSNVVRTVRLGVGAHPIKIYYVGESENPSLSLQWESIQAGLAKQPIAEAAFKYEYSAPLVLNKAQETVACSALSTTLVVQTDGLPWQARCAQDWVSLSPDSGTDSTILNIQVQANTEKVARVATVTVFCDGQEQTFTLTQEGVASLPGYEGWSEESFPEGTSEADKALSACPSGDGVSNLMKYALGLDPMARYGSVTTLTKELDLSGELEQHFLILSWPVNPQASDVVYSIESSLDAKTWEHEATVLPEGDHAQYKDSVPIGAKTYRFLRLKVIKK